MSQIEEIADKFKVEPQVVVDLLDAIAPEKEDLERWKRGNNVRFQRDVISVGEILVENQLRHRLGEERYAEHQQRQEQRRLKQEERTATHFARMEERLQEDRKYAAKEFGEGTVEYQKFIRDQESRIGDKAPFDFQEVINTAKKYGTGQRFVRTAFGRPRIQKRILTAEEAIKEEGIKKKRAERLRQKGKLLGNRPFFDQHRVVFEK